MSAWHPDPVTPDWFVATHRKRDCHSYLVMQVSSNRHNTSVAYHPWREDLTKTDVTSCMSTGIFHALYEPIPVSKVEHVEGLPIWECPCTECLRLDYMALDGCETQPATFAEFAAVELADRMPA